MHLWNWCKQSGWIIIYTLDLLVSFVNIFLRFKSEHYFFRCSMFRYCTHDYMSIVIVVRWTICWKLNWYIWYQTLRNLPVFSPWFSTCEKMGGPVKKWEEQWSFHVIMFMIVEITAKLIYSLVNHENFFAVSVMCDISFQDNLSWRSFQACHHGPSDYLNLGQEAMKSPWFRTLTMLCEYTIQSEVHPGHFRQAPRAQVFKLQSLLAGIP